MSKVTRPAPEKRRRATSRRRFLKTAAAAAGAAAATIGFPAVRRASAQVITLKMQSTWPSKEIFHEIFEDWLKKVNEMATGRLKIDLLPAGAVVPAFELIEAVSRGILDGGHGVPAYWFGRDRAASLFGTGPSFGLDAEGMLAWIHYGGGEELYNELLQKVLKFNVVSFFHGPMPTQPFGWFPKEVKGPDDLKGLRYRTVGLSATLFSKMGAAVKILPGGEIIPAMERGLLDAAEFNNTTSDKLLGFPDVRKICMARVQAAVNLVLHVLVLFPAMGALLVAGWSYAYYSFTQWERSLQSPFGPIIWPLKMLIPITAALMLLQGVAEVIKCARCLRTGSWA